MDNKIGRFEIDTETLLQGQQILNPSNLSIHDVVVIDEVGKLELQGKGWAQALEGIMEANSLPVVLTVRAGFVDEVIQALGIDTPLIYSISNNNSLQVAKKIAARCL